MLEKIVLVSVAYFCIATEMRFLAKLQYQASIKSENQANHLQSIYQTQSFKDSEAYHAKSLHVAAQFLPEECPLVGYILKSYIKNYFKYKSPKLKQ
jgi:hypothetical protein